jgi:hypothetical protein
LSLEQPGLEIPTSRPKRRPIREAPRSGALLTEAAARATLESARICRREGIMSLKHLVFVLGAASALLVAGGCAKGSQIDDGIGGSSVGGSGSGGGPSGPGSTTGASGSTMSAPSSTAAGCGNMCDQDADGVVDGMDMCPNTPAGEMVNDLGCSASQLTPKLQDAFPPYGLTWTPTGDLGRAGGLTWTYTGIVRGKLFHIYWIPCDDPATPCGVSLDGPIDTTEKWQFSAASSSLPGGKLVFTNATHITLADGTSPAMTGRLTVTIVGDNGAPLPFGDMATIGVMGRDGQFGAEITGTGFTVVALVEVQDSMGVWTPYLDYYDAAPTPDPGPGSAVSFGGSFYDD